MSDSRNSLAERVLFLQLTAKPSGSPTSGLMVVQALREMGMQVHAIFAQDGTMRADYEAAGCTTEILPHGQWLAGGPKHRRLRRWFRDWYAARKIVRRIDELRPKLVYVNTLTGLSGALAAKWRNVPCIWHVRELFDDVGGEMYDPWPGGRWAVRALLERLASRVVVISEAVRQNVLGESCRGKTVLIPNAVDDRFFNVTLTQAEARQKLGLPLGRPIVGVPGTLRPVKGQDFFLKAFPGVVSRIPDVLAAITGDGEPSFRNLLHRIVEEANLQQHVRFLGTIEDMPAFYRACDVICIPSRSESFGRAAIEAMAVGTPVVATRVGGLAETIEDGNTGLLVTYGQPGELVCALLKVLEDESLQQKLVGAGYPGARTRFSAQYYRGQLRELLQGYAPVDRFQHVGYPACMRT
jgi:glycosyltransferase involved in cell wall biosynthesis